MKRVSYIVVAPILTMAALSTAHATARVWQGGDGVFGTAGNWNPSGSPGSGDDLAFSGSTTACNINSSVTVNSINISVGVTVTQAAGVTLSINGSFTQSAGTFVGGNSTMDLGGDFNLSGGAFTATSGRMEVGGAFNKTSGSFTHHSGQVMLNATSSKTFATNGLTFNNLTLNDGVAGYWKLDDGTTPIVDSSGYTHSGTLTNTPTWAGAGNGGGVNFTDGNAMILNGTNQYATITRTTTLEPTSVSVSVWIKRNGTQSQYAKVVNKTYNNSASAPFQSYSVQLNNSNTDSGQIAWETGHTGPTNSTLFSTANAVQDGIWTHVVAVYDPAGSNPRKRLYVNGTLNASVDLGTALLYDTNGTGNLFFGQGGGGTQYFKGTIDDVRIYRRALSSAEVADLFSGAGRITSVATQTLNAALITAGDLNIVSGTLDVSAAGCASSLPCGVTVGGSYNNFGGLFTPRTGTLTFNGSASTNVLLTERLNFNNVTFSGTGTWTLQDRLFVDNTLAMSAASTLSQSSNNYTIHAGTLNKTAGTISGSGSVVLDSSSNQTLVVNSLGPSLRIEVPQESGLVGYWKLDEARYTTASDSSGSGYNGTLTNYATWSTNVPTSPAIPIDDAGSVSLDGTSQYVSLGNPANLNFAGQITMAAWVNMTASSGTQNILAHGYDASTEVYMRISGGQYQLGSWLSPTSYQTTYAVPGGDVGAWVHVVGVYDGTTWRLYRNGTEVSTFVTANGSKTVGANWAIGARGDGTSRWFGGNIDDVRIYNRGLSANEVSALYTSGYTSGSTIVYSLGGTSAVTGTLKLDSGSLDAVSYQNSITGATTINGGEYKIGSNSSGQTFTGGLTVNRYGSLTLDSAGGKAILGSGSTLTMDGTLTASSTTAAIQSAATTYTFNVGSVSGATPTLDITGLQVKNTAANGMYINSNTGATTTFTHFDNIAFSNGTSTGYNLRIYATSLYLVSNGCTFDSGSGKSVTNNVYLQGDGTADTFETRAIFGGSTCANTFTCESYDKDDDALPNTGAGPNGVGENSGDLAVIQWIDGAYADTAGSIEGFPTAAFDWSTFSYYSTYVAYHDTSGSVDTVYVRSATGAARYSWSTGSSEDIIGTPRWDSEGAAGSRKHYVYVATTGGKIYRLYDNGASLALDSVSPWNVNPYVCTGCTLTTPLAQDTSNVYWGGTVGGVHKLWTLSKSTAALVSMSPINTTNNTNNTAPAIWISGHTYAFLGLTGSVTQFDINTQGLIATNINPATGGPYAVNGRVTIVNNKLYAGDENGTMWCLDPANLATPSNTTKFWSYKAGSHSAAAAPIKSHYFDFYNQRVYFGDQDGHIFIINNSGAAVLAPWQPNVSGTDAFQTAPFYQSGVILAGTTTGTLYVIDANSNNTAPALIQTYKFPASTAISGIAYDQLTSRYIVSTANATNKDGKLYYLPAVTDPTTAYP